MKEYKNSFLKEIGVEEPFHDIFFSTKGDKREKRWKNERRKWGGYDSRVGWCLHGIIIETLYTWLKIYYRNANKCIDLEYVKIDVKGEQLTLKKCIKRMLSDLKFIIEKYNDYERADDKEILEKSRDCFSVLAECWQYLNY